MGFRNARADVRRLFDAVGTAGFQYRELGEVERREAAAAKWPLLSTTNREVASRGADRAAAPVPGDGGGIGRCTIALVSLCGGTGRTTVAANLATTLAAGGQRALAVDLDPQNLLALHFGLDPVERIGVGRAHMSVGETAAFLGRQRGNVAVLPFGPVADAELAATEARIAADPGWLRLRLEACAPADCEFVVLDVPAGRGAWLRQALAVADVVLVVLAPHPAAYASLPETEHLLGERRACYLVNGFDARIPLERDLVAGLRAALPDRVLPFAIQRDEAVREALLHRTPVVLEAADSQVTADFTQLADWVRTRWSGADVRALHADRVAG